MLYIIKPFRRPVDAEWVGELDGFKLILRNAGPNIKDQFGESPAKMRYIDAGLKDIKIALGKGKEHSALFIIDGGPRHDIIAAILDLEDEYDNFKATIFLCDAYYMHYQKILERRPNGKFLQGSNRTIKGAIVQEATEGPLAEYCFGKAKAAGALSSHELWYYTNKGSTGKS